MLNDEGLLLRIRHEELSHERKFFLRGVVALVFASLLINVALAPKEQYVELGHRLFGVEAPETGPMAEIDKAFGPDIPRPAEKPLDPSPIFLFLKLALVFLVFRASMTLKQAHWITAVYCLAAIFSLLYLIPLVGLFLGFKKQLKIEELKQNMQPTRTEP